MAVLPILRWPDPRLTQVCAPVAEGEDVAPLIADLFDTMYAAPGRGLAAPQVGVLKRVFVMDVTWKEGARSPLACINPEIREASADLDSHQEACLSIPGIAAHVARPSRILLRWRDPDGAVQEARFAGMWSVCAQHEYDHLDGRVIFDRVPHDLRSGLILDYGALE